LKSVCDQPTTAVYALLLSKLVTTRTAPKKRVYTMMKIAVN